MEGLRSESGYILLKSLPKSERTYEICYETIKSCKMELKNVPYKYRTIELIKTMKHYNGVIKFIPFELKSYVICFDAIKP